MRIFNLFRRKTFKPEPKSLRIDGIKTVLTPEPDAAELAAQALLESLAGDSGSKVQGSWQSQAAKPSARFKVKDQKKGRKQKDNRESSTMNHESEAKDADYYRGLSEKIRTAHEQERRLTMRYLAYCEEQIALMDNGKWKMENGSAAANSSLSGLERGLYAHQACVEREGGDLLKRWQHCLAECIMRQMTATDKTTDRTDDADEHQPSDI